MKRSTIGLFPGPAAFLYSSSPDGQGRFPDEPDGCTFHYRFRVSLQRTFSRRVGHIQPLAGEEIEPGKSYYSS